MRPCRFAAPSSFASRLSIILLSLFFAACSGPSTLPPTQTFGAVPPTTTPFLPTSSPPPTLTPTFRATPFQPATATPSPTPEPTLTPVPLPTFDPGPLLRNDVTPVSYITDTCQYLRERWDPENSPPGTIVVPIMYHSIVKSGREIPAGDNTSVTASYFQQTMEHARALGYQTVTSIEVAEFLDHNARIPARSLMLIVDDRRQGVVRDHFMPYLEKYHWTVTMAYITGVAEAQEWRTLEQLVATGYVDVQAHGYYHNGNTYIKPWTSNETIELEINGPIPLFMKHFDQAPTAFIWPGGDFNLFAVQAARRANYRIGFTAFSRGPLLFNWIPLGEPEREMEDPLLVLPRYWSTAAYYNLDDAISMSEAVKAAAEKSKPAEIAWMENYCQ